MKTQIFSLQHLQVVVVASAFLLLVSPAEGTCGNGVVEDQEECDCGPVATCKDPCCRPLVCTLKEGAECSNLEPCCRNCKFKKKWELCRNTENECDLPEYCTGHSSSCPPNIFHRDGRNCSEDQGYCSKGYCHTHLAQCKIIFNDRHVTSAPHDCYVRLNTIGNERGHCGSLQACSIENVLCGTLQCLEGEGSDFPSSTLPVASFGSSENDSPTGSSDCQPIGSTAPLVQDRTKCGNGKICQNQRCVNVSTVFSIRARCPGYDASSDQECSGNGFCTSRLTCLCHRGWVGRDCSESDIFEDTEDVPTTSSTGIVHDIPVTRFEPQGVVTHKHAENEEDTNYTLGMIFAIAVVTISITFFLCALVYCYLFSSPSSKAKESLDSQADAYSLDTNNGVHDSPDEVTKGITSSTLQQLEVKVDIPSSNGQLPSSEKSDSSLGQLGSPVTKETGGSLTGQPKLDENNVGKEALESPGSNENGTLVTES